MLILIDGNSVGHAAHNGTKLTTGSFETQAIFGYTRMMRDLRFNHPTDDIMVLWDGRAQFRYDILPGYKGARAEKREADPEAQQRHDAYQAQLPFIQKVIEFSGATQMHNSELEADDLAGYFVAKSKPFKTKIKLVTGDQDWIQLVDEDVSWSDHRTSRVVTHENFTDQTGYFSPQEFLEGKAFCGDTSDSIPPFGGIGEKTAPKFLAQYGSVDKFLEEVRLNKHEPKPKAYKDLATKEGEERFRRNYALMNLRRGIYVDKAKTTLIRGEFNEEKLRAICDRLAFVSITRQWDQFVSPFKRHSVELTHS